MIKSSLSRLQGKIPGSAVSGRAAFRGVSINSKTAEEGNLFVALRGERFDSHQFLSEEVERKVAAVVVERLPAGLPIPALVVPDTRVALGEIGRYWRTQFAVPVIGVTGSNGKTTVKEMIASILEAEFGAGNYLATRGNLNNEIGVPMTLLRLHKKHLAAVVELGMNHPGEIARLTEIALPTVGMINNAQREHQEFMASVEAVAIENGSVLRGLPSQGIAVFPSDDAFTQLWSGYAREGARRKTLTFGLSKDAKVSCTYNANDFGSDLMVCVGRREFPVKLAAAGAHNVRNALAAIACCLAIGIHRSAIVRGIEAFQPVDGRLQRKQAPSGAVVIDDTYNANPDSVRAAIDVLAQAAGPRVLVLGDMGEVGNEGRQFHVEIGAYARGRGIEQLYTLGELAESAGSAFGAHAKHHAEIEPLLALLDARVTPHSTVLVKGSRFMKMERVVQHLVGETSKEPH
jgi:UDP-N-acetylmuramoyl-tripeptide--D-alanyl-D-alanine ligase